MAGCELGEGGRAGHQHQPQVGQRQAHYGDIGCDAESRAEQDGEEKQGAACRGPRHHQPVHHCHHTEIDIVVGRQNQKYIIQ